MSEKPNMLLLYWLALSTGHIRQGQFDLSNDQLSNSEVGSDGGSQKETQF